MSHRRHFATLLIGMVLFLVPLFLPSHALAQNFGFEWTGVCVAPDENGVKDVATIQGLECLLANILTVFIALIGMAAFVMVLIAGIRYLLSGGNTKGTEQARSTLTMAILGIVVALSAFIILNLLSAFTGVDLTQFFIPRDTSSSTGATTAPTCAGVCETACTGAPAMGSCPAPKVCCQI